MAAYGTMTGFGLDLAGYTTNKTSLAAIKLQNPFLKICVDEEDFSKWMDRCEKHA